MGSPDLWLWLAACVLIGVGIGGTVLPALPGAPLVFGGLLLAAWIDDFREVGYVTLAVLGALTLVTVIADIAATMLGAKRVGATRAGIVGSALGTILGMFFGFAGLLVGPFAGALIGELSARRGLFSAGRVAVATWVALVFAVVVKLAVVFMMIGIFVLAYLL
ncbi:MAG: DUF456 family protein [Betaproteobacteria bacterium]|nr:DUF456 family protein [Betaproteobacteria bacterium]